METGRSTSMPAVLEPRCPACAEDATSCACARRRNSIREAGDELWRQAVAEIQATRLHSANRLLAESIAIDRSRSAVWTALGLVRFQLGDWTGARDSWRAAADLDPFSPGQRYLDSLTAGELRACLQLFERAAAHANTGQYARSLAVLDELGHHAPGLLPIGKLRGLLHAALGQHSAAAAAWRASSLACADDPDLLRYLATPAAAETAQRHRMRLVARWPKQARLAAAALAVAGVIAAAILARDAVLGASVAPPQSVIATPASGDVASQDNTAAVPGASSPWVAWVLAGGEDSLARLVLAAGVDTSGWSLAARARGRDIVRRAGWRHLRRAREAARQGDTTRAQERYGLALSYGTGTFYYDDTLYELALLLDAIGQREDAREVAGRLRREHVGSPFLNSVITRIAAEPPGG
jgi:tetratricopeptide (TPR) repeat protein